jgi:MOSC domain-containing protein YiiM
MRSEIFDTILQSDGGKGQKIEPGDLGENVTTVGIDILALGEGTKLHFLGKGQKMTEEHAVVVVTGLRNPCPQIDKFRPGLREKFIVRDDSRSVVGRSAGVMSTVEVGGDIRPGMVIKAEKPEVHKALCCV